MSGWPVIYIGINRIEQVSRDPLRGSLFENLVIAELIKQQYNNGRDAGFYYYRDKSGTGS